MPNMADPIWAHASEHPDSVALRTPESSWSYAQLRDRAATVAGLLADAGISTGDRVVLVAPSVPEFAAVAYGTQALGAILITMNTMSTPKEIDYVLADSGARLLIAWHACAEAGPRAAGARDVPWWVLQAGGELQDAHGEALTAGTPLDRPVERSMQDTAVLLYTSGTTGKPKGVQLTVGNLLDTARLFIQQLGLSRTDAMGSALPLFHVFGQCVCMNTMMLVGGSISLLTPFEPRAMLRMIRDHQLDLVAGVPTMWNYMLHADGDFGPEDFASLRMASSGGASLPVEVIHAFEKRFGCTILEGYGLTETTGAATYHTVGIEQRPGTVGIVFPETQVEIRDGAGDALPAGSVGMVHVKGPMVMKGYWNNEAATSADLQDGWLTTGDLGSLDEDGYLSIVDRAKDLIIRGGYNIYPREVEEALYAHPDIVEAAVIGVPHDKLGEEVAALIVSEPGVELDVDELRTWLKEHLSAYKVPHLIRFADALPKGATGKILKRAIEWPAETETTQGADHG